MSRFNPVLGSIEEASGSYDTRSAIGLFRQHRSQFHVLQHVRAIHVFPSLRDLHGHDVCDGREPDSDDGD